MSIKKGDTVKILSGKDKGKTGRVLSVAPEKGRVVVEGANLIKRHRRPRKQGEKGQVVQIPASLHASNVMLVCPSCSAPHRTKFVFSEEGAKTRVCRKCGAKV